MPIADMLIDSTAGNEILSFIDGYYGYNQIFIAEDDVAKTAFRCPGALASENSIGCMLAQDDENGHERAVYYLSRVLTDIETRGRLGKWMLALTEFDLQYVPVKAVKGQVIADFLVDKLKGLNDQGANIIDIKVNYWKLYFDGSKHKDGAGVEILIISPEGVPSEFLFELKYPCSINVAEYEALILGLEILIDKGALEVQILGDSQLVLKQLSKEFKLLASEREVLCIDEWEDSDWRKLIAQYLKDPNTAVDRKIKLRAMNFVLLADELYKKGTDGSLSRCLGREDQNVALGEVHNGICGAHQECQKHGSIQQIPAVELHLIIKPWPFRGWALDLIGLIHPPSSRQHKFILVVIDYFTKWVEAILLIVAGQTEIIDFIEENIIHRFGIPQTLSTDQGTMFTGQRIKNFAASRNINMVTSTPYYAQANGQVKAANKILIGLIKKNIGNRPRTWHETLSQVLWAYRNSPYKLVYGHDAVLPLEINLNTLRVSKQNDLPVDDYWNAMFDELNELDSERILALENIIRQKESIARSYNRRISRKSFQTGDLVLKVILPMEKKSRFLDKWSHIWEGPFQVIGTYSENAYQIKDIESGKKIQHA
ncbi:uncharacterized protein [Arachis hypogaea]|uniref:uncharacterized protein n=1 Tax=Arachis hypogaea TaxID=3818 RepID=UPI003B2185DC